MNLYIYQRMAAKTAIYPTKFSVFYPALGLAGEAGEIANKVKKIIRDNQGIVTDDARQSLTDEIGDCLWYMAVLCTDLGIDLDKVAETNLEKLGDRQARGKLHGDGDNR